jgi:IBR domain, a half RING-finger domain/C2 domain
MSRFSSLLKYGIQKESTIQVILKKSPQAAQPKHVSHKRSESQNADDDEDESGLAMPRLGDRQETAPALAFGDVLLVKLLGCRGINYFGPGTNPSVIVKLGDQTARSSVKANVEAASWNETFGLWIRPRSAYDGSSDDDDNNDDNGNGNGNAGDDDDSKFDDVKHNQEEDDVLVDSKALDVFVMNHNFKGSDVHLGMLSIPLDSIPRDQVTEKWFRIQDVRAGEVHMSISRYALLSPELCNVLKELIRLQRSLSSRVLRQYGISFSHFRNEEPYTVEVSQMNRTNVSIDPEAADEPPKLQSIPSSDVRSLDLVNAMGSIHLDAILTHNHALRNVVNSLQSGALRNLHSKGSRTLAKITNILLAQRHLYFPTAATNTLLITNVNLDVDSRAAALIDVQHISKFSSSIASNDSSGARNGDTEDAELAVPTLKRSSSAVSNETRHLRAGQLLAALQRISRGTLKSIQIRSGTLRHPTTGAILPNHSWVLAQFKSVEDAVIACILTQHKEFMGASLQSSFFDARKGPRIVLGGRADAKIVRMSIVMIAVPDRNRHSSDAKSAPSFNANASARTGAGAGSSGNLKKKRRRRRGGRGNRTQNKAVGSADTPTAHVQHSSTPLQQPGPGEDDWKHALLILYNNGELVGVSRPHSKAKFCLRLKQCDVTSIGPWSLSVKKSKGSKSGICIRVNDHEELNSWRASLLRYSISQPKKTRGNKSRDDALTVPDSKTNFKSVSLSDHGQFQCLECKEMVTANDMYVIDKADGCEVFVTDEDNQSFALQRCRRCIASKVTRLVKPDPEVFDRLMQMYSIQDLKDLLPTKQFNHVLDMTVMRYLDKVRIANCPSCNATFELGSHSGASRIESLTNELGIDRRPLSGPAQKDYLTNRFRCRDCHYEFCLSCKLSPYHLGMTCAEYKSFKVAPKCRFCECRLLDRHRMENPASPVIRDVCNDDACVKKASQVCLQFSSCGDPAHFCPGVHGESKCPPCLLSGDACAGERAQAGVVVDGKDLCGICCVEELRSAPVILLKCKHMFHEECVRNRIIAGSGRRITFGHVSCPLCRVWIDHPAVDDVVQPYKHVYERLKVEIKTRAERDNLVNDKRCTDPSSEFFGDPIGLGFEMYTFYNCFHCKALYFGGLHECDAADNDEKQAHDSEYLCMQCSSINTKCCSKPEHAEDIVWKCRFCCEPAVWFCFGTTHFCEYCHSHNPFQRADGTASDLEQRALCPSANGGVCKMPGDKPHINGTSLTCEAQLYCLACQRQFTRKSIPKGDDNSIGAVVAALEDSKDASGSDNGADQ